MEKEKGKRGVTVGTFDGVHLGHREVLSTLRTECASRGLSPLVITFDRHPLSVLAPERVPGQLMETEEKLQLLGKEDMAVQSLIFTTGLAGVSARNWLRRMRDEYDAGLVVIGYDNTFGCDGRSLDSGDYIRIGREEGLEVVVAPSLPGISSSAIRKAVEEGDMENASRMLGRSYMLSGEVVHGKALGRTLGFPTANLHVEPGRKLPKKGVYAALVEIEGVEKRYKGVVNIGVRPTVDSAGVPSIEVHLLDYKGDLYGRRLGLELLQFLRGEKKFADLSALKEAIRTDIVRVREMKMEDK